MKKFYIFIILIGGLFLGINAYIHQDVFYFIRPTLVIETLHVTNDLDQDGLNDRDDLLEGARKEVKNRTNYKSAYYAGGYPPDDEGVCTDVIWRALKHMGYDLKAYMDEDIKKHLEDYSRIDKPDPNIDFRRVKNQNVFFKKYAVSLTTSVIPYDKDNLTEWQGGDIVVLKKPDHIAIISDRRGKDGVPYVIHNAYRHPKEEDCLLAWYNDGHIIAHYRFYQVD